MSYRCELSGKVLPPGQKPVQVVLAIRPCTHPPRPLATRVRRKRKAKKAKGDPGGRGYQIAKVALVSPDVAAQLAGREPEIWPELPPKKSRREALELALYGGPANSTGS